MVISLCPPWAYQVYAQISLLSRWRACLPGLFKALMDVLPSVVGWALARICGRKAAPHVGWASARLRPQSRGRFRLFRLPLRPVRGGEEVFPEGRQPLRTTPPQEICSLDRSNRRTLKSPVCCTPQIGVGAGSEYNTRYCGGRWRSRDGNKAPTLWMTIDDRRWRES